MRRVNFRITGSALTLLAIAGTILWGCSSGMESGASTPAAQVRSFIETLDEGRRSKALAMLSAKTTAPETVVDGAIEDLYEGDGLDKLEVYPVETWTDSATVDAVILMKDGTRESTTVKLYREQGEWLIYHDLYPYR